MEYSFGIPLTKTVSVNSDLTDRRTKYVRTRMGRTNEKETYS